MVSYVANEFYAEGLQAFAGKLIDWNGDNIKALLATSAYSPNTGAGGDKFVSDIPAAAIKARSPNFAGKSETGGILNASTITFSLVASGVALTRLVVYQDTGADATSRLIIKVDTGVNFPETPIGGDISCQWDAETNKIGRI